MFNVHRQLHEGSTSLPQANSVANIMQSAQIPTTTACILHPGYNRLTRTDLLFSINPQSLVGDGKADPGAGISGRLHI